MATLNVVHYFWSKTRRISMWFLLTSHTEVSVNVLSGRKTLVSRASWPAWRRTLSANDFLWPPSWSSHFRGSHGLKCWWRYVINVTKCFFFLHRRVTNLRIRFCFPEYIEKDDTRLSGWGHCHKGFQRAKKGDRHRLLWPVGALSLLTVITTLAFVFLDHQRM